MTIFDAILQGIIQGLTEFLPVSSSGHLSLVQHFTGQGGEVGGSFSIMLHFGTLVAVMIAFWPTIRDLILEAFRMIGDLFRGKLRFKTDNPRRRMIWMLLLALVPLFAVLPLKDFYSSLAEDDSIIAEGICFLLTSVLLLVSDRVVKGKKGPRTMKARDAVAVGVAQAIAPLPGVSRSGSTICTGLVMGLGREFAVAFSFILGIPAVLGANILEFKDVLEGTAQTAPLPVLLVGMAVSLVVGLLAIWMVRVLVNNDRFRYFGYYTLVLGIATLGIGIFEQAGGVTIFQMIHG